MEPREARHKLGVPGARGGGWCQSGKGVEVTEEHSDAQKGGRPRKMRRGHIRADKQYLVTHRKAVVKAFLKSFCPESGGPPRPHLLRFDS